MLLGFGGTGLDDTRGYSKQLTPPGPNKCRQETLFIQTAALLLLQELQTLGVSLAQPFHVVLLVHLVAATFQATSIFITGLLPAVRGGAD